MQLCRHGSKTSQSRLMLIEAHNRQLVKGIKFSEKEVRKYIKPDKLLCDICVRSKMTRLTYKKIHKIRGKEVRDYISCDIAVFVNCEARHGFRYVAALTDHATKYCWVYPMRYRSEFNGCFNDFISVKIKALDARARHNHADGGAELLYWDVKEGRLHIFMRPSRHS